MNVEMFFALEAETFTVNQLLGVELPLSGVGGTKPTPGRPAGIVVVEMLLVLLLEEEELEVA